MKNARDLAMGEKQQRAESREHGTRERIEYGVRMRDDSNAEFSLRSRVRSRNRWPQAECGLRNVLQRALASYYAGKLQSSHRQGPRERMLPDSKIQNSRSRSNGLIHLCAFSGNENLETFFCELCG